MPGQLSPLFTSPLLNFYVTQLISEGDIVSELHIVIEGEVEVCAFGSGGDTSRRSNASRKGGGGGDPSKSSRSPDDGSKAGDRSKADGSKYGRNNGSSKRVSMSVRPTVNRSNRSATNPSFSVAKSGINLPSDHSLRTIPVTAHLSYPPRPCVLCAERRVPLLGSKPGSSLIASCRLAAHPPQQPASLCLA